MYSTHNITFVAFNCKVTVMPHKTVDLESIMQVLLTCTVVVLLCCFSSFYSSSWLCAIRNWLQSSARENLRKGTHMLKRNHCADQNSRLRWIWECIVSCDQWQIIYYGVITENLIDSLDIYSCFALCMPHF